MGLDMNLFQARNESDLKEWFNLDYEAWQSQKESFVVGEWRKANAIHNWFVTNLMEGIDECQRVEVSDLDLKDLKNLCVRVLKDRSLALELLPPVSGFFFGSTEVDEWYFEDLQRTVSFCDKGLEAIKEGKTVFYQASW